MSSITGTSSNFGFEALAVAMNKRAIDDQGKMALNLIEETAQNVQQIQAKGAQGNVGRNINTYA